MNDDFASMVVGIEEGRRVFSNLRKIIAYILSTNVPRAFPFAISLFLSIPLPIGVLTVLISGILMDVSSELLCSIYIYLSSFQT